MGITMSENVNSASDLFTEKLKPTDESKNWLSRNWQRVQTLFSNVTLRDFVFEPIKDVFTVQGVDTASAIRQIITMVAVANAVMAGLPGKLGIGVVVSMALEGWMAYEIARKVGVKLNSISEVWKYFGFLGAITGVIFYGIRAILGVAFSLCSMIPGINPMIFAELIVTNLVGVLFWIGFEEINEKNSFKIPKRALKRIGQETKNLVSFQWSIICNNLNPTNLKQIRSRLESWFTGELAVDAPVLRGDVATVVLMSYLLANNESALQGPIGQEFLEAIRNRYPGLQDASVSEIADHMSNYDTDQMQGVMSLVKGKLFERLVTHYENHDNDSWRAAMHTDETYPGSDIIFSNDDTGETIEVSLKATDSASYVEHALLKYPDIQILTTEEVSKYFHDDPRVIPAVLTNEDLNKVTEHNFELLLSQLTHLDVAASATKGVAIGAAIGLWPFVVAYMRKRISQQQLEQALVKVLGQSGMALGARLSYALILGPVFAWYMLARGVMRITKMVQPSDQTVISRRLEWIAI